jgi:hypothetical protein
VVVAVAVLAGVVALLAPRYLHARLERLASDAIRRSVTIGRVRVNPYTLSLGVDSALVRDVDGDTLLAWQRLQVNLSLATLVTRDVRLDGLEWVGLRARVAVRRDGALSIADIVDTLLATPSSGPIPEVRIGALRVVDARFAFDDSTKAPVFSSAVGPLALSLDDFSSRPDARNAYGLVGTIGRDEAFAWHGSVQLAPFRSDGTIELTNFALPTYEPYWRDRVRARLQSGRLTLKGSYAIDLRPGNRTLELRDGALSIADLRVAEHGGRDAPTAINVSRFDIKGLHANAVTQEAVIGQVLADGGRLTLRRDRGRVWNLTQMAEASAPVPARRASARAATARPGAAAARPSASSRTTAPTPWTWRVQSLRLQRWRFAFDDATQARPVHLDLENVGFGVEGLTSNPRDEIAFDAAASVAEQGGRATLKGRVIPATTTGSLSLAIDSADLRRLDPYIAPYFNVAVSNGRLFVSGDATFGRLTTAAPTFGFTGQFRVTDFVSVDAEQGRDFLRFDALTFSQMRFDQRADALFIGEIALARPALELAIERDGSFSVDRLRSTARGDTAVLAAVDSTRPAKSTSPADSVTRIVLGALRVRNGRVRFVDRSMTPTARFTIGRLNGTFGELSSDDLAHATFDINARLENVAPLTVTGRLAPLQDLTDSSNVVIGLRGLDLLPFDPYSRKFAGYQIRRGQGKLDVNVRIVKRELDARNVLTLDGFRFGDKVESPDATSIPLKLVFAVLRDRNDRIVFDVPVRGSLDDPSFGIWRVVGRAAKNVALALVESPFKLLMRVARGGGPEATPIDHAEFAPGSAELSADEENRLSKLSSALSERPSLQLIVEPWADDSADVAALRRQQLETQYRESRWHDLRRSGNAPVSPDSVRIEAAPWERYLRRLTGDTATTAAVGTTRVGGPSVLSVAQLESKAIAAVELAPSARPALAEERARRVRDALINRYGVEAERVRIAEVGGRPGGTPRSWLLFKVDAQ